MSIIKRKQIEDGFVDQDSKQTVSGEKIFTGKHVFKNSNGTHIVILEGFIYWVADADNLNREGNIRQGMVSGRLTTQTFTKGVWI